MCAFTPYTHVLSRLPIDNYLSAPLRLGCTQQNTYSKLYICKYYTNQNIPINPYIYEYSVLSREQIKKKKQQSKIRSGETETRETKRREVKKNYVDHKMHCNRHLKINWHKKKTYIQVKYNNNKTLWEEKKAHRRKNKSSE